MILFDLRCGDGHGFEGWFRDGATYDRQAGQGEIACPVCGDTRIAKAMMAPALARRAAPNAAERKVEERPAGEPGPDGPAGHGEVAPAGPVHASPAAAGEARRAAEMLRFLRALQRHVETRLEPVGPRFAEEARRIHHGEAAARGIWGEASAEEAEALDEEGIAFGVLPRLPPENA
jgi:hypothetical protein